MLSTPLTCCSSGVATDCSMVDASAPVYTDVTRICGGTICGNCEIGRPRSATMPISTVRIAMTIATIGRRMKNLDMFLSSGGRRRGHVRLGRDDRAVSDRRRFDDHPIARFQSVL